MVIVTMELHYETDDTHILNDPLQPEGCADFNGAPTRQDIGDRCSYVERQVTEGADGVITISTHGEGYNPVHTVFDPMAHRNTIYDFTTLNEMAGIYIFFGVDRWIQSQLITRGVCPTSDD